MPFCMYFTSIHVQMPAGQSQGTTRPVSTPFKATVASTNAMAATTDTTTTSAVCPVCGTLVESGQLSCCARGGGWHGNCGGAGDAKFDHTWFEGIQACKQFAMVELPAEPNVLQEMKIHLTPNASQQHREFAMIAFFIGLVLTVLQIQS